MGKSDPYLQAFFGSMVPEGVFENVGFFGQSSENFISAKIDSKKRSFFDLSLKNWDINRFPYEVNEKFDLIVCTRCAYFCKEPLKMMDSFKNMLSSNGKILIDWGLGDHWRFENFKVGWLKDNEQEWCYQEDNYLWSCVYNETMFNHPEIEKFLKWIQKFNYHEPLEEIIKKEVPVIFRPEYFSCKQIRFNHLALWEESPQLYSCLLFET